MVHNNKFDDQGRPAGGCTHGRGFTIAWQDGPRGSGLCIGCGDLRSEHLAGMPRSGCTSTAFMDRNEPNGAFVEDVITAAVGRLEFYQSSPFACDENAEAIGYLKSALAELGARTTDRTKRGVEGTWEV